MLQRYILVIRADRSVRIAKKPRLAADEVGVAVTIDFPNTWGKIISEISVSAPDFSPEVRYEIEPAPIEP